MGVVLYRVIYYVFKAMCGHFESRLPQTCWIQIGVRAVTAPKQKHASEFTRIFHCPPPLHPCRYNVIAANAVLLHHR